MLFGLLAETLRAPTYPPEQIEKLRAQIMTGLALRAQSTGEMAAMKFYEMVYAGHPYRHPEEGHPETVQAISADDLADFHRGHYGPKGMVIAVVGGIEPQEAVDKVSAALGDWSNPEQPEPPELPEWEALKKQETQKHLD